MIYFTFADSFNHNVKIGGTDIESKKSIIENLCRFLCVDIYNISTRNTFII